MHTLASLALALSVAFTLAIAPAAHADDDGNGWFLGLKGNPVGPLSAADVEKHVKAGDADGKTLAWRDGMADWLPLSDIGRFKSLFAAKPPPLKPAAPLTPSSSADPPPLPSGPTKVSLVPPPLPSRPPLVLTPPPLPAPTTPAPPRTIIGSSSAPPPEATTASKAASDSRWYYADGDAKKGPVSVNEMQWLVKDKHITKATLVWSPGMKQWLAAGDVADLKSLFKEAL